ncbi:beta-galactosidase [candidate division WOR-3 bacterium]|nr:beta-galactosidase [candidate division WOR-3 bacterium]
MRRLSGLLTLGFLLYFQTTLYGIHTSVEIINDVPTICANGQPYNIAGWTVATLGGIWNLSVDEIKQRMDFTKSQGFDIIEIFVPWQMVEWNRDQFWWERMDSLIDYAGNIGLYTIIQITATIAPPWFGDTLYPDAVFYTFDPDSSLHSGEMWGRLAISGEGSFPIFYHPGYYDRVDSFFVKIITRYKNYPSLFGWTLCLWFTGEYNYPGGGYGIAGFADYSAYTEGLYGKSPPYPLNMFSQSGPDLRSEWLDWTRFRIEKKREVLYHFAPLVKSLDPNHILIGYPGGGLWGEWDNGYIGEIAGMDYASMVADLYIDVIRGAPQVSKNFFDIVENETSPIPYMIIGNVHDCYRNGKPYLLQCERSCDTTSLVKEIKVWAEFHKSLGCDLIWWEEPDTNSVSGIWLPEEKNTIGNTKEISNLPKITGITISDFAFIDLPFESSKYYSDNTFSLVFAMKQVKAFIDAGLPFDCISENEILQNPSILNDYGAIGFLFPDMYYLLATDSLKNIVNNYPGVIWYGNPIDGYNYWQSGYSDTIFLGTLRLFYDTNGISRHHYDGNFIYIVGNKPYIFVLSRDSDYSGAIDVNIKGWNLPNGDTTFIEYNSGTSYPVFISNDMASLNVNLVTQEPYLFVLKPFLGVEEQKRICLLSFIKLFQNHPNPFTTKTEIRFSLDPEVLGTEGQIPEVGNQKSEVGKQMSLKIYNVTGRLIKIFPLTTNHYTLTTAVSWDGKNDMGEMVATGIYFCQLQIGNLTKTKKLILLR